MTTHRRLVVPLALLLLLSPAALGQSVEQGRFGRAIKVGASYAAAEHAPVYVANPLTVELWARVNGKADVSVLLSNEPRRSKHHWELYTEKETGRFAVSLPGYTPATITSTVDVADDAWHHLAFVLDGGTARLYVDGKPAAEQAVKQTKPYPDTGPLLFGYQPGVAPHADTMIDEVRISRVARSFTAAPDKPYAPDADTIGLWHFDEDTAAQKKLDGFADASATGNTARPQQLAQGVADNGGFDNSVGGKTRWSDMDFGPFFSSTITPPLDKANVTHKGISIRLGKDKKHAVTFDTELLRMSAAWEGPFIKLAAGREGLSGHPEMGAKPLVATSLESDWVMVGNPESNPVPLAGDPSPRRRGHFDGLYVNDDTVILAYHIHDVRMLESYAVETHEGIEAITRTLEIGPTKRDVTFRVRTVPNAPNAKVDTTSPRCVTWDAGGGRRTGFGVAGESANAITGIALGGRGSPSDWVGVGVTPHEAPVRLKFVYLQGVTASTSEELTTKLKSWPGPADLRSLTKGGPSKYPPLTTKGTLGKSDGPYAVDTLTAPDDNPWKSFLRFGGHDFFSNGDCAVCSVSGDVWVVSGIDDKLEKLTWRRFATGLFQPLGLKIIDDQVYVLGRDQITRLHDLNKDGEADFYENFNNDGLVTTNGHSYVTCLERDKEGNLYYIKCGDRTPHGGTVLRVSPDGKKLDVVATGVRNANGLGMSPTGVLSFADNQGDWVPASRIDLVTKPMQFLGYTPMSKTPTPPTHPGYPIVWMPQNVDNSSGGQVWVEGDKWGLPAGTMLHTSYGGASLLHVMPQQVKLPSGEPVTQAFVHKFPLTFQTGIMRGRFRPQDGQLYVCGLRGWQTAGTRDGALQRVRYTGKPLHQPTSVEVVKGGVKLTFGVELDPETAKDPGSWSVLQWNYRWSSEYGSKFWSVRDPQKQGFDTLEVKKATLAPDGKSVTLDVPAIGPAMQVRVTCNVDAKDGSSIRTDVYGTIHAMP